LSTTLALTVAAAAIAILPPPRFSLSLKQLRVKHPQIKPQQFEQQRLLTAPLEDGHQATQVQTALGEEHTYIKVNGSKRRSGNRQ